MRCRGERRSRLDARRARRSAILGAAPARCSVAGLVVTAILLFAPAPAKAACSCGYSDGRLTLQAITVDGSMSDWASILADPDNLSCDADDSSDRDYPVQSTGRNLTGAAATWNSTFFYMWIERSGSASNKETFVYYCESNDDGRMQTGEFVVAAEWRGSNGNVDLGLYRYSAVAAGDDSMTDAQGYADGCNLPGC